MILDQIVADKKLRLEEVKKECSLETVREIALLKKQTIEEKRFRNAMAKDGLSVIAEYKNASPSHGMMHNLVPLEKRIADYTSYADAISCLTEEKHFHGSKEIFESIRTATDTPMLRKDFMIDTYQFYEACAMGADAILLIAAILDDATLYDFYSLATELGLDALVECHDESEVERALRLNHAMIGINNRNLKDFTIDLNTTKRLAKMVPDDRILVAESGILTDADIEFLSGSHVDAVLIGQAFMEARNPGEMIQGWKTLFERRNSKP